MEYETIEDDFIENHSIDTNSLDSYLLDDMLVINIDSNDSIVIEPIDSIEVDSFVIDSIEFEPIDINYNSIEEFCPIPNSRDMEYELNNTQPDREIKCKNYEFCYGTLCVPKFKSNYLCDHCDTAYEKPLEIKDNVDCPICLETKRCVIQPNCSHFTCVDCFKLCYYSYEIVKPIFPYSMIKDEYDDDKKNPKWKDYPLIKIYRAKMKKYIDERNEKKKKTFLKKCPLCRK